MIFQKIAKKITRNVVFLCLSLALISGFAHAQNSPLAIKGDQEKFGNLQVVNQYGHVIFADQPDKATVAMLKDMDVKMVINIRGEAENEGFDEQKAVVEQGIAYVQVPYMKGRTINADAVDEILGLVKMTGDNGSKVFLHCTHSQRAGSFLGVALVKAGYSKEDAGEMAKDAGMTSEFVTKIHNDYVDSIQ